MTDALITREMNIGEVVQRYPSSVEVLLAAGVHCVGCHVSYSETLEQGFRGHGMSEEEIDQVVTDLNKMAQEEQVTSDQPVVLTIKAAEKLKSILAAEGKPDAGLRVDIVPGGCEGSSYGLELADAAAPQDEVFEQHGVKLFVGKADLAAIHGSKIDYVDSLVDGGFRISNPHKHHCGCGKSFS